MIRRSFLLRTSMIFSLALSTTDCWTSSARSQTTVNATRAGAAIGPRSSLGVAPFEQEIRIEHLTDPLSKGVSRMARMNPSSDTLTLLMDSGSYVEYENGNARAIKFRGDPFALPVTEIYGQKVECYARDSSSGMEAGGTDRGLFTRNPSSNAWKAQELGDSGRSWGFHHITALAFDNSHALWIATSQGLARQASDGGWSYFTGSQGLPYYDFTCAAAAPDGTVWFGTKRGAIHYDGTHFLYRASRRWLPHDEVHDIVIGAKGDIWIATAGGISQIRNLPMTLKRKAELFEEIVEARHNRFGYVTEVNLRQPGRLETWYPVDTDNDGLWTGMYGAAACFRYAATHDLRAKAVAKRSIDALIFLEQVTGIPGFPARCILPTSGPDINQQYTVRRDLAQRERDPLWKVISPHWPVSKDGKWYWKCDTSSDEIDGHFFNFAVYYDLVADTPEEKKRIADHTHRLMDHIIDHGYYLVDHDGKPTRWGVWAPEKLNWDVDWWGARGLNSLEILSYLKVAEHITGDAKYTKAYNDLIEKHQYHLNTIEQKRTYPYSEVNDSDDEMAFMCYYTLLRYEKDPALRAIYTSSLHRSWSFERPERNPLFNFITAAIADPGVKSLEWKNDFGDFGVPDGIDTLKHIPTDLISWTIRNSHRKDLFSDPSRRGHQRINPDGSPSGVLFHDESSLLRWNHNPFQADGGSEGLRECEPTFWLLPYYLGLYHRLFSE